MIHIDSGYFVAGAILDDKNICVRTAPIIKYMVGWHVDRILSYANKKNWKVGYNVPKEISRILTR